MDAVCSSVAADTDCASSEFFLLVSLMSWLAASMDSFFSSICFMASATLSMPVTSSPMVVAIAWNASSACWTVLMPFLMFSAPSRPALTAASMSAVLPLTICAICCDAVFDCSASFLTSSATTAKPRPASPARAASMAAFSARRFVCDVMFDMTSTISEMCVLLSLSFFMDA